MAYIVSLHLLIITVGAPEELTTLQISVNAAILRDSGGTCVCSTNDGCTDDAVYLSCVADVQRDLITTTASISALSSFLMGLLANLPVGMAPGLGLNAYVSLHPVIETFLLPFFLHPRYHLTPDGTLLTEVLMVFHGTAP